MPDDACSKRGIKQRGIKQRGIEQCGISAAFLRPF
ncbi:hypothetical protein FHS27_004573 [Rhodopirellula rubra]|uniref:Uncharacterized protein n=1 Tax=Aporhodopirellula rubra TaxID=980271 RepID=A0A7W5E257_9BACT|nr:hypothetical protein [Aporhodopirellula rubra]